jgi:hypothetical protein
MLFFWEGLSLSARQRSAPLPQTTDPALAGSVRTREHAFDTKKPRAAVNVSDISFVVFVADFDRPEISDNCEYR